MRSSSYSEPGGGRACCREKVKRWQPFLDLSLPLYPPCLSHSSLLCLPPSSPSPTPSPSLPSSSSTTTPSFSSLVVSPSFLPSLSPILCPILSLRPCSLTVGLSHSLARSSPPFSPLPHITIYAPRHGLSRAATTSQSMPRSAPLTPPAHSQRPLLVRLIYLQCTVHS